MTPEPTAARRAVTGLALAAALFAAVVLQLTVVNRLPLPGPGAPGLVLLLVTAIAVATSPRCGAVSGFAAGLALDVAPPVTHYAGQDTLVFCLAGYGAARVAGLVSVTAGGRDRLASFAVMAAAAAAGEAAQAALGLLLAQADVTGAVISRVLPSAVLYDLLLSPAAWWLVARITRGVPAETAPVSDFGPAGRLASAFRQASAGAAPGLRLAGSGGNYQRLAGRPVPRLNFAGQRPARVAGRPARKPATMTSAAFRSAPLRAASARPGRPRAGRAGRGRQPRTGWLGGNGRAGASRAGASRAGASRAGFGRSGFGRSGFRGSASGRGCSRYGAAPSRSRLRRRRRPWRRRRQRLLRLVGVGR